MKQFIQDKPSMIFGNQKWKGKDPIFINKEELIIIEIKLSIKKFLRGNNLNKMENKKLIDAIDWTKKYFNDASEFKRLFEFEIRGINLNKLISNPTQQPNHEFDETEIKVLKHKINIKNILFELIKNKIQNKKIKWIWSSYYKKLYFDVRCIVIFEITRYSLIL